MKTIGIIESYNGKYGIIKSEIGIIDFEQNDISFNQIVKEKDVVEFRVEEKTSNIKVARNISPIKIEEDEE